MKNVCLKKTELAKKCGCRFLKEYALLKKIVETAQKCFLMILSNTDHFKYKTETEQKKIRRIIFVDKLIDRHHL